MPLRNAGAFHDDAAALSPQKTAIVSVPDDELVTYGELADEVNRVGNVLESEFGVEQGERITLFFPNELSHVYNFFGATRMGAVPVLMNYELSKDGIQYIVDDSEARIAISSSKPNVLERALEAVADADAIDVLVIDDDDPQGLVAEMDAPSPDVELRSLPALVDGASTELEPLDVADDDPALQPYTSGSTGKPKGCIIPHVGAVWNIVSLRKICFAAESDRTIFATPLYHKNAWLVGLKPMLEIGGSVVMHNEFDTSEIVRSIDRYDVTALTGIPSMFKMIVNDEESLASHDVTSMDWGILGSEPVPEPLLERCQEVFHGIDMIEAYGLTEGGPIVTSSPRWGVCKVGSAGLAFPDCETRVVEPGTTEELPRGEVGELIAANPSVEHGGYYKLPEKEEEVFERIDGRRFIHTEDLVRKDEDGYHYIVGRLDDMMIVGGENVYPAEVENLLQKHPAVTNVAVVSVPHARKGEAPVAFVIVDDDGVTEDDLKQFALDTGPAYAHPRRVFFRDDLPLSGTRKVNYSSLEAEARDRIGELE